MNLKFTETNAVTVAEVVSDEVVIKSAQDALDLIANAGYGGASRLILHQHNLTPAFFDLKTGVAGEVAQKCSNYKMGLTVIGDFDNLDSESLKAFIRESNRGEQIAFVPNMEAALARIR